MTAVTSHVKPMDGDADPLRARLENLRVGYHGRAILPPLSFTVRKGEIWALFGPNGGGKSSLLRTLLGLQPRISGRVHWFSSACSAVQQHHSLDALAPQQGMDVVLGGTGRRYAFLRPWHPRAERQSARQALADTDSNDLRTVAFRDMSEGQKQRIVMARALASNPSLLTLDEPTSAMDPNHEAAIFGLLQRIALSRQLAIIVASHHMHVLAQCADHAVYVDCHEAVATAGTFQEVSEHPAVRARYGDLWALRDPLRP